MAMSVVYTSFCGMVVSETRGGVERDYVPDTLGSTAALVDDSESITDRWEYWPYGEVSNRTGTNPTPFTFVGMLGYFKDKLDKLFYVRARHLKVDLVRWLTVDPLWPTLPDYSYVFQIPVLLIDPAGLAPVCQRPNPCSELKGTKGACIALLCSLKSANDLINVFKGLNPKELAELLKLLNKFKNVKPKSPEDCCKEATSGGLSIGSIVAKFCGSSWWQIKSPQAICKEVHGSNRTNCHACCDNVYPNFDKDHGLCVKICGY